MNFNEEALKLHAKHKGKIEVVSKVPVKTRDDLSTAYTPGVAEHCRKIHADKKSLYNTPPTYNIYMVGKVIKWIQSWGGLEKMKELNERKAAVLYDYLDSSSLFYGLANACSIHITSLFRQIIKKSDKTSSYFG